MRIKPPRHLSLLLSSIAWLAIVALGLWMLLRYEDTAGNAGVQADWWPADSVVSRTPGVPTLLLAAHPQCPCTRASMEELDRLMAQVQGKMTAVILVLKPEEAPEEWSNSSLARRAAAIPGVTVVLDDDGKEAKRFKLETSGHTLLFDPSGRLLFSGGITGARGHEGDNAGRASVVALVNGKAGTTHRTPVFGCSLF